MSSVSVYRSRFENNNVTVKMFNGIPWFNGIEVAVALGYKSPRNTVNRKVKSNEKRITTELRGQNSHAGQSRDITYINEPGVYRLVFSSKLESAERFKTWVFTNVLPKLRQSDLLDRNILHNETDLHYNVIKYIRLHYPETVIVPGLGEQQSTKYKRRDAFYKGYIGGQPDIIIPLTTRDHNGLAIELKSPSGRGVLSTSQKKYLGEMVAGGYRVLVCNNYKKITKFISEYLDSTELSCQKCRKFYSGRKCLLNHNTKFHKVLNSP